MKRLLGISFVLAGLSAAFFSCSGSNKKEDSNNTNKEKEYRDPKNYFTDCKILFSEAQKMDSILFAQNEVNKELADKAIRAFTDYAYYCASDSLSPIFLIKTGQVAMAINNVPQAKEVLEKCIQSYPRFEGVSAAMFLLAQLYDEENYLNNEEEARRLYQEIIDKYPNSPEAQSAKGALKLIGKTDKEIIEELKKQNREQQNSGVNISIQ